MTLTHLYCVIMFAILYYKKQILGMPVGWYWFALIVFVDVSINFWIADHVVEIEHFKEKGNDADKA